MTQSASDQAKRAAFAAKVEQFAAGLDAEEQQWLTQILLAADRGAAVQGYGFDAFGNFGTIQGEATEKGPGGGDWRGTSSSGPTLGASVGSLVGSALGFHFGL